MHKAEIGWVRRTAEGTKLDVFARRVGQRWLFFARARRYEQWQPVPEPPLEDWLDLLDAVRRRVARRLLPPEEIDRIKQAILQRYPHAEL